MDDIAKFLSEGKGEISLLFPEVYQILYFLAVLRRVLKGSGRLNEVWDS